MLFNSIQFAIFLPIVFLLYWFPTRTNVLWQNRLLLVSSYFFYACWDWRFLFLLLFSTLLDFLTGLKLERASTPQARRFWLCLSVGINLGILAAFKYYDFFAQSFVDAMAPLGWQVHPVFLKVVLPVGISFYTLHGLSYVIDVYKQPSRAEHSFTDYAVFVSFFPLLVAGPIERASHLLPQIKQPRVFDRTSAVDGLRQILWGLVKKVIIADSCAIPANQIFGHFSAYAGSTLALGAAYFTLQIYCDFSGYSDIATGTARLFGIDLLRNFAYPYFSRDIAEFWRRWHISLTSWCRDYLYIPLGGSRIGRWIQIRNTILVFLVSGLWHGAQWNYIAWGALNALYFLPLLLFDRNRAHMTTVAQGRLLPTAREALAISATFAMTLVAWIVFRCETLADAGHYIAAMLQKDLFSPPPANLTPVWLLISLAAFVVAEWLAREEQHALATFALHWPTPLRWSLYLALATAVFYSSGNSDQFIYFQF